MLNSVEHEKSFITWGSCCFAYCMVTFVCISLFLIVLMSRPLGAILQPVILKPVFCYCGIF